MNKENIFYVVKSTCLDWENYLLFNSVPHKQRFVSEYYDYYNNEIWSARHGKCYFAKRSNYKFQDLTYDSEPIKVKLVRCNDDNDIPDFYIQRCGENFFITNKKERVWKAVKNDGFFKFFKKWKWVEFEQVPHICRISNKLFPEITEEMGVVEMMIKRY